MPGRSLSRVEVSGSITHLLKAYKLHMNGKSYFLILLATSCCRYVICVTSICSHILYSVVISSLHELTFGLVCMSCMCMYCMHIIMCTLHIECAHTLYSAELLQYYIGKVVFI